MAKELIIHNCKSVLTEDEYANMAKYYGFYKANLIRNTIVTLIIVILITIFILKNFIHGLILFIIIEIILAILNKVRLKENAKKTYRMVVKQNNFKTEYMNYFYKDYFIRKTKQTSKKLEQKFKYEDLDKIIETDNNFYLSIGKLVFIFQKEYLNEKTIIFIRKVNEKIYINKLNKKSR